MTEWKRFSSDLVEKAEASPARPFESFRGGQANKEKKKIYFWTTNAARAEAELRRLLARVTDVSEHFSIKPCYGASPDKVTLLVVKAKGCPTMCIKEVPGYSGNCNFAKWQLYQAMYTECAKSLGLDPTKKLLYKGEGQAQVCERLDQVRTPSSQEQTRRQLCEL